MALDTQPSLIASISGNFIGRISILTDELERAIMKMAYDSSARRVKRPWVIGEYREKNQNICIDGKIDKGDSALGAFNIFICSGASPGKTRWRLEWRPLREKRTSPDYSIYLALLLPCAIAFPHLFSYIFI